MHEMEVVIIRQLLEQLLDYHFDVYLLKLRDWFSHKISKEQFDNDLSSILQGEILQLHNQLLLAILAQSSSYENSTSILPTRHHQISHQIQAKNEELENLYVDDTKQLMSLKNKVNAAVPFSVYNVDCEKALDYHGDSSRRFPFRFARAYQVAYQGDYSSHVNVIPNVTHGLVSDENIRGHPVYSKALNIKKDGPLLTSEANLFGRFLVEAWKRKLNEGVENEAVNCAVQACIHHIKNVIMAVSKGRKSFRVREGRCVHSVGAPYPNPYLRQGHQIFEETYSSETAKLADVMQIPSFLPTSEERERLAALEVAASAPPKYYQGSKATLTDLQDAIKADRKLIPNYHHRTKILESIFQRSKGHGDGFDDVETEDEDCFKNNSRTEPIVSY